MNPPIIWTIAGSDCTGGAGIQADIKTIHALGGEACSIITAVTAQNSSGVSAINSVSLEVITEQLTALSADKPPAAIKIGLLANAEQVTLISKTLREIKASWSPTPLIVYDPVAIASTGDPLTEDDLLDSVKAELLPVVDVLTPNIAEMQQLSGVYPFSWNCVETGANKIYQLGTKHVVVKGGHLDIDLDYAADYGFDGEQGYWLANPRIDSNSTHGSGCTFASAITTLIARGYTFRDAFTLANAFVHRAIKNSAPYTGKYGAVSQGYWPSEIADFPSVLVPHSELATQLEWRDDSDTKFAATFPSVNTKRLGLYPVVPQLKWVKRLLKAGVKTLQYREKHLTGSELQEAINTAVNLGKTYSARVFINDFWQQAIKAGAYGVHLGQEDIESADLKAIQSAGLRLGISTHGHYEFLKAQQYKPSYIAVGAIFPTKTKDMTGQIQGIKTLQELVCLNQQSTQIPMVAIGGINIENAASVTETGVGSIAVVTAITEASDPEAATAHLQRITSGN